MRRTGVRSWTLVVAGSWIIAGTLTGCGGGGSSDSNGTASTTGTTGTSGTAALAGASSSAAAGAQPTIQGTAPGTATVGQTYNFQPQGSGGSGTLSYTIANKPAWATFNASTGDLSGTPSSSDVGTDANVEISVTDGSSVASLPTFTITVAASSVAQGGPGTVTLTWQPPTQYSDGSPLTSLAGYNIYYGTASQSYSQTIKVSNPGLSNYVVQNLPAGTYYFAIAAYDSTGAQSSFSPEVAAAVQ